MEDSASSERWATHQGSLGFEAERMHADLQARMFGVPTAPVQLGRFVVLEQLGRGGMGVVYAAYDPTLDRKIAVKLMQRDDASPGAAKTLLGEAQALARLAHPNVITVHDVGHIDDRIFIAMELVDGVPLSRWQQEHADDWAAVLDAYVAAGEGLAAAHRAGLVHRDFKPDNVLVGRDGRVRVLDFGLARVAAPREEPASNDDAASNDATSGDAAASDDATATGDRNASRTREDRPGPSARATSIAGTLPYMSPEQVLGEELDARSDQFSFCVALCEALYLRHPFLRGPAVSTAAAIVGGEVQGELTRPEIPAAVREVLRRGLSTDRAQRFEHMDALLQALAQARPRPRPRRGLAWALLPVALGVGYLVARPESSADPTCAGSQRLLDEVWNPQVATEVEAAFVASTQPHAATIGRGTIAALDDHAARWVNVRQQVCEATARHGEQSVALLDSRMHCLDRRLRELDELVQRFRSADARTVSHALAAVHGLPATQDCATQALGGSGSTPKADDRGAHRELDELQARSISMRLIGDYPGATAAAEQALARARELDDAHRIAELSLLLGKYAMHDYDWDGAVPRLQETLEQAERSKADDLRGLALGELAMVHAFTGRLDEGLRLAALSRAAGERAGLSAARRVQQDASAAWLHMRAGDYDRADEILRGARPRADALGPEDMAVVALLYNTMGVVQRERGELPAAVESLERAYAMEVEVYGEDHPEVAMIRLNLGAALLDLMRIDEAIEHFRGALQTYALALGPESLAVADAADSLANALAEAKQTEEALWQFERAQAIYDARGESAEVELGRSLGATGTLYRDQGRPDLALPLHQRSLALWEKHLGPEHADLGYALVGIGFDLLDLRRPTEAIEPFERALRLRERSGIRPAAIAEARLGLARALVTTDPARATELARTARDEFDRAGNETWRDRASALLAELGARAAASR